MARLRSTLDESNTSRFLAARVLSRAACGCVVAFAIFLLVMSLVPPESSTTHMGVAAPFAHKLRRTVVHWVSESALFDESNDKSTAAGIDEHPIRDAQSVTTSAAASPIADGDVAGGEASDEPNAQASKDSRQRRRHERRERKRQKRRRRRERKKLKSVDVSGLIFPDTDSDQEGITIIGGEEFDDSPLAFEDD